MSCYMPPFPFSPFFLVSFTLGQGLLSIQSALRETFFFFFLKRFTGLQKYIPEGRGDGMEAHFIILRERFGYEVLNSWIRNGPGNKELARRLFLFSFGMVDFMVSSMM